MIFKSKMMNRCKDSKLFVDLNAHLGGPFSQNPGFGPDTNWLCVSRWLYILSYPIFGEIKRASWENNIFPYFSLLS